MPWRVALVAAALVLVAPSAAKKQGQEGQAAGAKPQEERRPLYSPWTDDDTLKFWNADSYATASAPQGRARETTHQPKPAGSAHVPKSAGKAEAPVVVPPLPPFDPQADESVLVMRALMKRVGSEDYMEEARLVSKKHSLGDARQAAIVTLLRNDFERIKHMKRPPVLEAAIGYGDPSLPPVKMPRWPDPTAKRLSQMLGTILDKATREKPAKPASPPKLRKLQV